MRIRFKAILLILGAMGLLAAVIVGIVTLAVAAGAPTPRASVESALPTSLFELEASAVRFGPVALSIAEEVPMLEGQAEEKNAGPNSAPPSETEKPNVPITASPSPAVPPDSTSMSVELVGEARNLRGTTRAISYKAKVRNTGKSSISALDFLSHVPTDTQWMPNVVCAFTGYAINITYPRSTRTVCVAGSSAAKGSMAPESHLVKVRLSEDIPSGSEVSVQWTVQFVGSGPGEVVNHAHALTGGKTFDSGDTVTKVL